MSPPRASERAFLTAEWRYLAMLNFEIAPAVLRPLVPRGTELDTFAGRALVSVVGFRFLDTRVRGVPVPLHRNFDEVNLRFYVRRAEWRVFVRELVPRRAIAWLARSCYNEPYRALPMRHRIAMESADTGARGTVTYEWRHGGRWHHLEAVTESRPSRRRAGRRPSSSPSTTGATRPSETVGARSIGSRMPHGQCGACSMPGLSVTSPSSTGRRLQRHFRRRLVPRSSPPGRPSRSMRATGWQRPGPVSRDELLGCGGLSGGARPQIVPRSRVYR